MSVTRKVLKGAAWVKAPKLMLARRNPKKAALLAAASWVTSRIMPGRRRRRTSFARTAAQGLGAAAVAIPVGLWLGRKALGGGGGHGQDGQENLER
jgi:hypothetical protein